MKSSSTPVPFIFTSITLLHDALNLPKPLHPLVSLVDYKKKKVDRKNLPGSLVLNFYKISYKEKLKGKAKYGQNYYDFDAGELIFISPGQVISATADEQDHAGFSLYIHPDFIRNYPLGKNLNKYGFFSYSANEALHLSEKEKRTILSVFKNIGQELQHTIDDFSQDVVISLIEVLLNYSNRFYKRQFITRRPVSNDLLEKFTEVLQDYLDNNNALYEGLPTVQHLSEKLNVSASYLGDMLRSLTGQNTQQHIHNKLIEKAKEILAVSNFTVAEIAYQLGFEHPQSFNKLFKSKTNMSPLEFRQSFN